jgi:hypothetical protein
VVGEAESDHGGAAPGLLVVDAHVHYHGCFPATTFVRTLASNMDSARAVHAPDAHPCIWVHGIDGDDPAARLADDLRRAGSPWRLEGTPEPSSFRLDGPEGKTIHVVEGQQIRTRENIEILAPGPRLLDGSGVPALEIVAELARMDRIAILPWGVGKWWGPRGALVNALVTGRHSALYVGDNGNRPSFWPRPAALARAEAAGAWDLPGTDPLPHPAHAGRAGRSGFVLPVAWDPSAPLACVRAGLHRLRSSPPRFGELAGTTEFVRDQVAARWHKRLRRAR